MPGFIIVLGAALVVWRLFAAKNRAAICRVLGAATLLCYVSTMLAAIVSAISIYFGVQSLKSQVEAQNVPNRLSICLTGFALCVVGIGLSLLWTQLIFPTIAEGMS